MSDKQERAWRLAGGIAKAYASMAPDPTPTRDQLGFLSDKLFDPILKALILRVPDGEIVRDIEDPIREWEHEMRRQKAPLAFTVGADDAIVRSKP